MTFAALIAGIRAMDDEIARLRAHVAALTAAPATTIEPGLDLDARVPCASCGGEFRWSDDIMPGEWCALCHGCGSEWDGPPAPVTWRTLATSGAEVPAAYVARLVAEVDRLRALLTAAPVTTSPATTTDGKPLPCPFCGSTDVDARTIAYVRCLTCEASGPTWPDDAGAVELWNTRAPLTASAPSSTAAPHSGAEPTVEAGAFAGRRACWDCAHDSEGNGQGICELTGTERHLLVVGWIRDNCTYKPHDAARNCPGWAPKSGEVSDG